jgi:hypothetical protein
MLLDGAAKAVDEQGRFRVALGSSSLRPPPAEQAEASISVAALEKQARAERMAKEAARRERKARGREPLAAEAEPSRKRPAVEAAAAPSVLVEAPADPSEPYSSLPPPVLRPGLVVKCLAKEPPHLYRQKATLLALLPSGNEAELAFSDGTRAVVSTALLQTVLPRLGGRVMLLYGEHSGQEGTLHSLDEASFSAVVSLREGGTVRMPYEAVSKIADRLF